MILNKVAYYLVVIPSGCSDIALQTMDIVDSTVESGEMDIAHSTRKSFHAMFDVTHPAKTNRE